MVENANFWINFSCLEGNLLQKNIDHFLLKKMRESQENLRVNTDYFLPTEDWERVVPQWFP